MARPFLESNIPGLPCRRGKVRDVYDLGDRLVIIASDRISAFDWILPTGIPDKGRILTAVTRFWFDYLKVPNHFLSGDVDVMGPAFAALAGDLRGRSMLVKKADVVPGECVVRGVLAGSGGKEYLHTGSVCGVKLPPGLKQSDRLPEPIFTPATKESSGHDINIPFERMVDIAGQQTAEELRARSIDIYRRAADFAKSRGILIADTKFEWGRLPDGAFILVDEALTPDSSRFWPEEGYRPGSSPPSYDKQFVRDWLESTSWDKNSPPPELPVEVVERTRAKYLEACQKLTGKSID
ncbi:MAG: phosphoribosylaminoimidazolesuccinocarboxamide synthase [Gemmataceae bacterium]